MIALRNVAFALILSLLGGAAPGLPRIDSLVLERTTCYGTCPSYRIVVSRDGHVAYEGRKFVKELGRREKRLTDGQMRQLDAEVQRVHYFSLRDRYAFQEDGCPTTWTDNPAVITSVRAGGQRKQIMHGYGCQYEMESRRGVYPADLTAFESRVDAIVGVAQWIGSLEERVGAAPPGRQQGASH